MTPGDDANQRQTLETLVAHTGKPEYWRICFKLSERSKGMTDHNTLDINPPQADDGNVVTKDDYICWRSWPCSWAMPPKRRA